MYLPRLSTRRVHLRELEGTRSLSSQREYHLLSTEDGGMSTATLWSSGSKRLSQRPVAGGWQSADCTQPSLLPSMFGNDPQETELADFQSAARFGWIWSKSSVIRGQSLFGRFGSIWSESVANRFTREMQVNRRFKILFPAYSAFGQQLITVMTKINQKVSRFRLSWRW